mmetsp:Transcript_73263/g.184994  ORF Transcript_73263/g.184994 Transcript_73263/m.184994 type:complete len:205 (-) Transcript_73263:481-1095(-)
MPLTTRLDARAIGGSTRRACLLVEAWAVARRQRERCRLVRADQGHCRDSARVHLQHLPGCLLIEKQLGLRLRHATPLRVGGDQAALCVHLIRREGLRPRKSAAGPSLDRPARTPSFARVVVLPAEIKLARPNVSDALVPEETVPALPLEAAVRPLGRCRGARARGLHAEDAQGDACEDCRRVRPSRKTTVLAVAEVEEAAPHED